jgi:Tfp pilus assembly protein PilF
MRGTGREHAAGSRPPRASGTALNARHHRLAGWLTDSRTIPFALAAASWLVFSPALLNGFVHWDDSANLFDNPGYRGLGWTQIRWMFTSTLLGHYIPVTWLTFGLDYTLWGMNPFGYHLTNTLIHAASAAIFYLVALRLLAKATRLSGSALRVAGVTATLFFALHPLRTESVAWATERRDVLSGFFFLLTVLTYLKAAESAGPPRRRLLVASVGFYALALLSKSIVMTLPLVLVLLDVYPLGRITLRWAVWKETATRAVLREKVPYLLLGLIGAITSYWAVASNKFLTSLESYGWPARIAMAGYSLWFYLEKTVLPGALSPLYELPAVIHPLEPRFLLSMVAVLVISAGLLAVRRRWPAGLAVWVYYGIVLGPVSGIVHAGHQLAHDRYSYLSCLGWAILAGAAVGSIARAAETGRVPPWVARVAAGMVAVWILGLATLTWSQIGVWRDTETLWRYAVATDPRCSICQSNLGSFFFRQKLYRLAREKYELALALRPDHVRIHGSLGVLLQRMGDFEGGMHHLGIALARYPDSSDMLNDMAVVLLDQKRYSEAMPYLERANRINPNSAPGLVNLGVGLIGTGQPEHAVAALLRAKELRPDEPMVHANLSRAYRALGQTALARQEYEVLQKLDGPLARSLEPQLLPVK